MITDIESFNRKNFFSFTNIEIKNETKKDIPNYFPISPDFKEEQGYNSNNLIISKDFNQNIINSKINSIDLDEEKNEDLYFIKRQIFLEKKIEPLPSTSTDSQSKYNNSELNLLENKRNNGTKTKRKNTHTKFEKDNVMKKLNIHFISFIVKFVNFNIKKLISNKHPLFCNLSYNFKQKINNSNFNELKSMTIGEVLKNEGSNKNKRNIVFLKDHNERVFNSVYKTILKDLLDINYIEFFRYVYLRSSNEKFVQYCKNYKIPKKILFFDDFLQKQVEKDKINGEQYKERLKNLSKIEFISEGYPLFETKTFCKLKGKK